METVIIAVVGSLQAIILAVLGIFGPWIISRLNKADTDRTAVATNLETVSAITAAKLEEIHTQTNSNLAAVNAKLDVTLAQNQGLKDVVAVLRDPTIPTETVTKED